MKHFKLFTLISIMALLTSCYKYKECDCEPKDDTPTDTTSVIDTTATPIDTTVTPIDTTTQPVDTTEATSDTAWVERHLVATIDRALPMTGLVLWVDNARDRDASFRKSISLEFAYCLPSRVVKGKENGAIVYDWSSFDNMLSDIASREHQAIVRFRYEYPSSTDVNGVKGATAVPDYIKALSDYNETYSKNPGGDGPTYYADWSNSELQWFTKQFYTDFCARYAHDNRLAFLEVGFGHWSEYHIYGTDLKLGQNFPSKAYQTEFFNHMTKVSDGLPWCVSIDAADDTYSPVPNNSSLLSLRFGLFDDSFMHQQHEIGSGDGWNETMWNIIGKGTRWQTSPCGGEVSYYTERDQHDFLSPNGLYGTTWEQAAAKYHITFMISNDATEGSYGTAQRFLEAAWASGYKFEITELKSNHQTTSLTIANKGIAPIYRPAYVNINGQQNEYNLMNLLPNNQITLQFNASKNDSLDIEIRSDFTLDKIPFNAEL